jgi:centromere protein C
MQPLMSGPGIAFTEAMLALKSAENDSFAFQKVFNDGEFLAAGILEIPAGGAKPSRSTRDNTYVRVVLGGLVGVADAVRAQVFYVAEGAVGVTVHKTNFYLCQGGMLMVPSGPSLPSYLHELLRADAVADNYFSIDNPSDRDARLFFCQARKGVGGAKPTYSRPPRASVGASSDAESYRRASTSVRP